MSIASHPVRRRASRAKQLLADPFAATTKPARPALVIVGSGMAAAKLVEEVIRLAPDRFSIRMFGAEPHGTYNRILLSSVLGGFADPGQLWLRALEWYE